MVSQHSLGRSLMSLCSPASRIAHYFIRLANKKNNLFSKYRRNEFINSISTEEEILARKQYLLVELHILRLWVHETGAISSGADMFRYFDINNTLNLMEGTRRSSLFKGVSEGP